MILHCGKPRRVLTTHPFLRLVCWIKGHKFLKAKKYYGNDKEVKVVCCRCGKELEAEDE